MRKILSVSVFLMLIFFSNQCLALSLYKDGNELLRWLEIAERSYQDPDYMGQLELADLGRVSVCIGYIQGICETVRNLRVVNLPNNMAPIQAIKIVKKYLKNHPELLHQDANISVITALGEAFPKN